MIFLVTGDCCVKKLLNGNKNFQKLKKSKTENDETFRIDTLWNGTDNKNANLNQNKKAMNLENATKGDDNLGLGEYSMSTGIYNSLLSSIAFP